MKKILLYTPNDREYVTEIPFSPKQILEADYVGIVIGHSVKLLKNRSTGKKSILTLLEFFDMVADNNLS